MGREERDRLEGGQAVRRAARSSEPSVDPTDMPVALGDCIAELAERLGIEVQR